MMSEDLEHFLRYGYVKIEAAFPDDVGMACQEILWEVLATQQILKHDRSTWVKKCPLGLVYNIESGKPWDKVFTARLKQSMDQLCGNELIDFGRAWGCGWWMITMPGQEPDTNNWKVDGAWHIDGLFRVSKLSSDFPRLNY